MLRMLINMILIVLPAVLVFPGDATAGRGGGRGGGYGGGMAGRGGMGGASMGGASAARSPAFSAPRAQSNGMRSSFGNEPGGGNRNASYNGMNGAGSRNQPNHPNVGSAASSGSNNRNSSPLPNGGAGAAGTAYNNRNQPNHANAGSAYNDRNNTTLSNGGAGLASAGYANRNNTTLSNGGAGLASAGYTNRNNTNLPYGGAGLAGAGYANRNNKTLPNGGAGLVGAGYANRNNVYLPYGGYGAAAALGAGYWNGAGSGLWGLGSYGPGYYSGVGAWGTGSPIYTWGYSNYDNPYSGGYSATIPASGALNDASSDNYNRPISTTAAPPDPTVEESAIAAFEHARDAFKAGDYDQALRLNREALSQTPDDVALHEFLALILFARGEYERAAAPLYAVLSVGPGWNWTTLSGFYPDVETYTNQLRKLEAFVKKNSRSSQGRFVLAYHYLCEGHDDDALEQLKWVVKLQPSDTLSAQIIAQYQPAGDSRPASVPASALAPGDSDGASTNVVGVLTGKWSAATPPGSKVTLSIDNDGKFRWIAADSAGKSVASIAGTSSYEDGIFTLTDESGKQGSLVGKVINRDDDGFTFRLTGAPPQDPGLKFKR
jgi:tetratricopeptide (TPR) repeat protein